IGDILYFIVLAGCAFTAIKFVIKLIKKEAQWKYSVLKLLQFIRRLLWVYITFYLLWGLNYYRSGITAQLHLKVENYSTED
ncbi:DUF3810 family protein, partial [Acinetobacter baumannii]